MAIQRVPRGTRVETARLALGIERSKKDRLDQLAAHAGVSSAAFVEAVIDHLETELTDRGLPNWWPAPEPKDGELPIDAP